MTVDRSRCVSMTLGREGRGQLESVLTTAQERGFVGPGPIETHIDRALDLAGGIRVPTGPALDLGSGGGLPGLPLALAWPETTWFLLEGSTKRARFLGEAAAQLGLSDRVVVLAERAENAGHGQLRGRCNLVVARSFGPPAVTAECGAPFLEGGGRLVVAEPPGGLPERWVSDGLAILGLRAGDRVTGRTSYQTLIQDHPCPDRFPRRVGVPARRPLF
jgi:16S rRNA (guanine527-N7)-methyltransferase